jgi:hypothetical protein
MSSIINVPSEMSCVNAAYALWQSSKPALLFSIHRYLLPAAEESVSTAHKIHTILIKNKKIDYLGGRLLKIDFSSFPKLDVSGFDSEYGSGAALSVLEAYNKIPQSERFDPHDSLSF